MLQGALLNGLDQSVSLVWAQRQKATSTKTIRTTTLPLLATIALMVSCALTLPPTLIHCKR